MRGKLSDLIGPLLDLRNIPAYAGKTACIANNPSWAAEHPRVCGENDIQIAALNGFKGTSPRMRGKRHTSRCLRLCKRNIPAYAGKT